jgi:predicted transposase/invertase (TIGR01784 family)
MKHRIDPMVDCVAKAILGDAAHPERTVDFLQSVLRADPPIVQVTIENPYSPKEFVQDRQIVVDIRARDASGRVFAIEVQVSAPSYLPERILYGWSSLFAKQLVSGEPYTELRPVISIWLLGQALFPNSPHWHHTFRAHDPTRGVTLSNYFGIHTLELCKWAHPKKPLDGIERWMYLFSGAKRWDELPADLADPIMRQAMDVLERFSEKESDYYLYQARENYLRIKLTDELLLQREREAKERAEKALEEARAAAEQERAAKEQERAAKEQARAAEEQARAAEGQARAAAELAERKVAELMEQLQQLRGDGKS